MVKKIALILIVLMMFSFKAEQVQAGKDFASAFSGSLLSFPPGVNIAGFGGFWAALPTPYSQNPAAYVSFKDEDIKALIDYDVKAGVYSEYGLISFREGPDAKIWTANAITSLGKGVIRIDYCNISTNRAKSRVFGLNCKIDGDSFQIGYGYPINDKLSVGISLSPIHGSNATFKHRNLTLAKGKSTSQWYRSFGLGILYRPKKWLYLGLAYGHNKSKLETKIYNLFNYRKSTEYPVINLIRPGIVIRPKLGTTIGLDWLWGQTDNEHGKKYYIKQWFFGIEQYLCPYFALRAGSADGSPTAGIGIRWKRFIIDYAYIDQSIKEMKRHLGKSSAHLITLTYYW
jgi:hypothetical protein